ncbi:MAG: hypothetical protein JOZ77_03155 [Candidatus Eremiobacteraeota bacterium]|nr:hypothetical protein [Candidatus Eremiobacteraeota bacterium]
MTLTRIGTLLLAAALAFAGCTTMHAGLPPTQGGGAEQATGAGLPAHAVIGFSVDTPKRAATAAAQGITSTILYGGSPAPGSDLERALSAHNISVVDAAISGILFYWECHRTHTIKPPPKSYGYNPYCRTDEDPKIDSPSVVLRDVAAILKRDATRPYVVAHWVLDDWAWWDNGSGRELLQRVHAEITKETPGRPAICGFGAAVLRPGKVGWDPGTGANYSNGGCDIVGWYNYSPFGRTHPSNGKQLDWSMKDLLPAMARTLEKRGWNIAATPLYGIGQAWGGSYEGKYYQPGLTRGEMLEQAKAFCDFGAAYIGWYAWDDSGYEGRTETPNNSATITAGIAAGLKACRSAWRT